MSSTSREGQSIHSAPGPAVGTAPQAPDSSDKPPPKKRRTTTSKPRPRSQSSNGAAEGEVTDKPKRTPSCDLCRARKVRCVKSEGQERCEGCQNLNQRCEFTHERKKPGPANSYARPPSPRPSAQAQVFSMPFMPDHGPSFAESSFSGARSHPSYPPPPKTDSPVFPEFDFNPFEGPFLNDSSWATNTQQHLRQVDLPFLPISPSTLMHPVPGDHESTEESPQGSFPWMSTPHWDHGETTSAIPQTTSSGGTWDAGPLTSHAHPAGTGPTGRDVTNGLKGKAVKPGRDRGVRHVEEVIEWSAMMRILHAYHAHLYPLMPIVHWPSFSQQLIAREDEKSDAWRAFLLSLIAYSIIQLPRSTLAFIPVPELRKIHQRCYAESKKLQNQRYPEIALVDISMLYCRHIYLGTLGLTNLADVTLSQAIRLSHAMNLHDERLCPDGFNVVEREMRRRTFWLLYGSDRTITALTASPLYIYDADLCLPLPMSLDDNLLTPSGAFPQPHGTTPVLAGFHFNTRLLRLLGTVLTSHRTITSSSSNPGNDPFPILNLPPYPFTPPRPSRHFLDELDKILADFPPPLQLYNAAAGVPTPNGSIEGEADHKDAAAFGTCRANLLVTQALVRFAIRQYAKALGEPDAGEPEKDWAEKDVLGLLESMSPESLAANGDSLRLKVLFVASSLLDKYPSSAEGHSYVSDFLGVYTRILQESHTSLLEVDRSGEASRDVSPH